MTASDALARLRAWPRLELASLPTPLRPLPRLAGHVGRGDLWLKSDDETGFALGGNKVRKLETELGPPRLEGVTCLITGGGPQSNHCRVTAALAARLGLRCVLVLNGPEPAHPTGNALLQRLFGAEIRTVADRAARAPAMEAAAEEVRCAGGNALVVPVGASTGRGCLGYALATLELAGQLEAAGPAPGRTVVFVSSSSCGTLAGLALGAALLDRDDLLLVGVSADVSAREIAEGALSIAGEGARLLGWEGAPAAHAVRGLDDQVGPGYGVPTAASTEAAELFARAEGVVLDPTYTAKAAAALLHWIRSREGREDDRLVFLHTGGHPALLA